MVLIIVLSIEGVPVCQEEEEDEERQKKTKKQQFYLFYINYIYLYYRHTVSSVYNLHSNVL